MAKTANLYARIEPEIKAEAEKILEALRIPVSVAINLFYKQIILQQGLPFIVSLKQTKQSDVATAFPPATISSTANTPVTYSATASIRPTICSESQATYNASIDLKSYRLTSTEEPTGEMLEAPMNQVGATARKSSENAARAIQRMHEEANAIIAKNRVRRRKA